MSNAGRPISLSQKQNLGRAFTQDKLQTNLQVNPYNAQMYGNKQYAIQKDDNSADKEFVKYTAALMQQRKTAESIRLAFEKLQAFANSNDASSATILNLFSSNQVYDLSDKVEIKLHDGTTFSGNIEEFLQNRDVIARITVEDAEELIKAYHDLNKPSPQRAMFNKVFSIFTTTMSFVGIGAGFVVMLSAFKVFVMVPGLQFALIGIGAVGLFFGAIKLGISLRTFLQNKKLGKKNKTVCEKVLEHIKGIKQQLVKSKEDIDRVASKAEDVLAEKMASGKITKEELSDVLISERVAVNNDFVSKKIVPGADRIIKTAKEYDELAKKDLINGKQIEKPKKEQNFDNDASLQHSNLGFDGTKVNMQKSDRQSVRPAIPLRASIMKQQKTLLPNVAKKTSYMGRFGS